MKKLIFLTIIVGALLFWKSYEGAKEQHDFVNVALAELPEQRVILFATEWCPMCKKTRELFEQLGVAYYEYDVEKSEIGKEEYKNISDSKGVPLVYYKGEHVLGFNESKIKQLLNKT